MSFKEGDVLISGSGQSGTAIHLYGKDVWVHLLNNDIWIGPQGMCRHPQGPEDLASCPLHVERMIKPIKKLHRDNYED